jgi:hypothetical protein
MISREFSKKSRPIVRSLTPAAFFANTGNREASSAIPPATSRKLTRATPRERPVADDLPVAGSRGSGLSANLAQRQPEQDAGMGEEGRCVQQKEPREGMGLRHRDEKPARHPPESEPEVRRHSLLGEGRVPELRRGDRRQQTGLHR